MYSKGIDFLNKNALTRVIHLRSGMIDNFRNHKTINVKTKKNTNNIEHIEHKAAPFKNHNLHSMISCFFIIKKWKEKMMVKKKEENEMEKEGGNVKVFVSDCVTAARLQSAKNTWGVSALAERRFPSQFYYHWQRIFHSLWVIFTEAMGTKPWNFLPEEEFIRLRYLSEKAY